MKKLKEWFINAPWGKIAMVSWGTPSGEPVLLVHGRQDSCATFIPLLKHMPDTLFYVGVDLPGHGWSDPMPKGVVLSRIHLFAGLEYAVKHLNWDQFIYIGHSLGSEQGFLYNLMHPGKIKELILLDPVPSIQKLIHPDFEEYYRTFYAGYYDSYERSNNDDRVYTKRGALEAVMRARGLTEEQAEVVLSRNLRPVGENQYRLSWDRRLKQPPPEFQPLDHYYEIFTQSPPPTLAIIASRYIEDRAGTRAPAERLVARLQGRARAEGREFVVRSVEGAHDVHLTRPHVVAEIVRGFINRNRVAKL